MAQHGHRSVQMGEVVRIKWFKEFTGICICLFSGKEEGEDALCQVIIKENSR